MRRSSIASSHDCNSVSIHAPAWGATFVRLRHFSAILFQSTHPHGVRLRVSLSNCLICVFQSTHPHGVRRICAMLTKSTICFNPRTRMGCDRKIVIFRSKCLMFQSTHPHGVRHGYSVACRNPTSFNPRTRMGCDRTHCSTPAQRRVSIHAPAWGATATP